MEKYGQKMCIAKAEEFKKQFKGKSLEYIISLIPNCEYNVYRMICNYAWYLKGYCEPGALYSYSDLSRLVSECNKRVSGEVYRLQELCKNAQGIKLYWGTETYSLFTYDMPRDTERSSIKSALRLYVEHVGKPLSVSGVEGIYKTLSNKEDADLIPETKGLAALNSITLEGYEDRIYSVNKMHCEKWQLMGWYLFSLNYEGAYKLVKEYDKMLEQF